MMRAFWRGQTFKEAVVSIESEVTSKGILIIKLIGRMQLQDLQGMEDTFRKLIKGRSAVIVDLSELLVLFSMGIRTLIQSAQTVELRGGKMVLMAPTKDVLVVLKASGASALIPICADLDDAEITVLRSIA